MKGDRLGVEDREPYSIFRNTGPNCSVSCRTISRRVRATGTSLLNVCGVGVIAAARLIGELGCTLRIHSAAALAALAGIAPVAVSSGGRNGHRLNRGGNRRLNRTFHMIAVCQLRCEPLAQAYYAKKRAEGKTVGCQLALPANCLTREGLWPTSGG
jgi:transposase